MDTILIVDDLAVNREFLVTLLGYRDHRLIEAADGLRRWRSRDLNTLTLSSATFWCRQWTGRNSSNSCAGTGRSRGRRWFSAQPTFSVAKRRRLPGRSPRD